MSFRYILILLALISAQYSFGQEELSAYFLKNTGANLYLNPANTQDATLSWALPSLYYMHGSAGAGISDIVKNNILDLKGLESKLKKNNSFVTGFQLSLFGLYYSQEYFSIHIGHNLKTFSQIDYNDKLFDLILNGNAQYIGETIHIGPYANLNFYNEFYLGFGAKLQNLRLGIRIKRLNGLANAYTPKHEFSLYTDDEIYQLKFTTEYHIYTNLYADSLNFGSYTDKLISNIGSNGGWAFDFGLKADITEQFTVSASLLDMGYIHWTNSTKKITSEGSFELNGFDFNDFITDSLDFIQLDSLGSIINVQKTDESYKAGLPVHFYLGLQYYPVEEWEINALYYNYYTTGRSNPAISLMAKYKPSEYFHTSLSYTWNPFAYFNLGWSAETHLKWFHFYFAMDNIIDIFRPVSGNYFNVRTGMQIDLIK